MMTEILTYVMLNGKKDEDIFNGNIDIEGIRAAAYESVTNTTFEVFFEEPEDELVNIIRYRKNLKSVEMDIHLKEGFYHKHIGKYMDRDKILLNYMFALEGDLDEVCWKSAAGFGCKGGCHG